MTLETLRAKDEIADRIHSLFVSTDRRDWVTVGACFADVVHFDMTSLGGGERRDLSPAQITAAWNEALKPIRHVHHQVGNLQITVEASTATASCYGIALHHRPTQSGNDVRRFVGSYDFSLVLTPEGWRITLFRFILKFVDGNLALETSE